MKTSDVIVIGAGIAGASAAWALAPSMRVLLLEAEPIPGFHATGRSAAMLVNGYGGGANQELCRHGSGFLARPPDGFTATPLLNQRGVLWLAREDQSEAFRALMAANSGFQALTVQQGLARCPVLSERYLGGGSLAFDPSAKEIDVHALHHGYLRGFKQRGGTIKTDSRITSLQRCGASWRLKSQDEVFECQYVINAAGAWADRVAVQAGVQPIGLVPMMRTVMTFPAPPDLDITAWPFVVDVNEEFYFKPEAGTVLASPADEQPVAPSDVQPEEFAIASGVDRIERATTMTVSRIISKWAGLRSFAPDRAPVVGWDPEQPTFFWLAAQGGSGVMTAPALAEICADLFNSEAGSTMDRLKSAIGPARFRSTPTRVA